MSDQNEDDIAGALREAFDEHPVVERESEDEAPQRARDASGKFTANADDTPVEAAARLEPKDEGKSETPDVAPVSPETPQVLSVEKPPSSWTPAAREKWPNLDPDIRQEIIRREEASMNGVRQMQERFQPLQNMANALSPIVQEAQQLGADPIGYIGSLAQSERVLRTADMPAKFNELLRIADQYGMPLREIINEKVGQEVLKIPQAQQMQIPPQMQQELNEIRRWREETERSQIEQGLTYFSQDKEFFGDVRMVMADLIEKGLAPDVPSAYDQACWMVPEVRQVMLQRQSGSQVTERQKKAATASMPASGKVAVDLDDDEGDDIGSTVRNAFNRAATGRV